jgi:hypothetical protein
MVSASIDVIALRRELQRRGFAVSKKGNPRTVTRSRISPYWLDFEAGTIGVGDSATHAEQPGKRVKPEKVPAHRAVTWLQTVEPALRVAYAVAFAERATGAKPRASAPKKIRLRAAPTPSCDSPPRWWPSGPRWASESRKAAGEGRGRLHRPILGGSAAVDVAPAHRAYAVPLPSDSGVVTERC